VQVFYSPLYDAARHNFDTTRKARWVADSLRENPIAGLDLVVPERASQSDLERIHDPAYVEAVRGGEDRFLAESSGFDWDKGVWEMATAMSGGMMQAVTVALRDGVAGSLSTGMHHAEHDHGKGFCTFNGLVLAARHALDSDLSSVTIVDFDAHHGGGTHYLIAGEPRIHQVDLAVNSYDQYVCHDNCTVLHVSGRTYLQTVKDALAAIPESTQLIIYNAGMDPYRGCPTGGIGECTKAVLNERERLVFDHAARGHIPIAFGLAGGYCQVHSSDRIAELVSLHRLTLEHAAAIARVS
jgi:acetoin utilization deacetylase AcuC-like enzyme